jgi:hypothetical protein
LTKYPSEIQKSAARLCQSFGIELKKMNQISKFELDFLAQSMGTYTSGKMPIFSVHFEYRKTSKLVRQKYLKKQERSLSFSL